MRIPMDVARLLSDEAILRNVETHPCGGEAEPWVCECGEAQMFRCPQCGTILAISTVGLPCEHVTALWERLAEREVARRGALQ